MCKFISCISTGNGKPIYFGAAQRKMLYSGQTIRTRDRRVIDDPDSHSMIAAWAGLDVDMVNKYEYLPLNKKFIIDQLNVQDDSSAILAAIKKWDLQRLCPPQLKLRPIINPLTDIPKRNRVTKADINLLQKWTAFTSVRDAVGESVGGNYSELNFFSL